MLGFGVKQHLRLMQKFLLYIILLAYRSFQHIRYLGSCRNLSINRMTTVFSLGIVA